MPYLKTHSARRRYFTFASPLFTIYSANQKSSCEPTPTRSRIAARSAIPRAVASHKEQTEYVVKRKLVDELLGKVGDSKRPALLSSRTAQKQHPGPKHERPFVAGGSNAACRGVQSLRDRSGI